MSKNKVNNFEQNKSDTSSSTKHVLFDPSDLRSLTSGFNSRIRPEGARSTVIYLEQEDPNRPHREKIACAMNLGDFELAIPSDPNEPEKMSEDGRSVRRKMWDAAVEALVATVGEVGFNPKVVRNDKNSCRLTLKQCAENSFEQLPDEYFSLELAYCSEFELEKRKLDYVKKLHEFDQKKSDLFSQNSSWRNKIDREEVAASVEKLNREKKFFIATTPDPREMDSGLIFSIELISLKEYGVTKSKIAAIFECFLQQMSLIKSMSDDAGSQYSLKVAA